jgi:hypothetical protein
MQFLTQPLNNFSSKVNRASALPPRFRGNKAPQNLIDSHGLKTATRITEYILQYMKNHPNQSDREIIVNANSTLNVSPAISLHHLEAICIHKPK